MLTLFQGVAYLGYFRMREEIKSQSDHNDGQESNSLLILSPLEFLQLTYELIRSHLVKEKEEQFSLKFPLQQIQEIHWEIFQRKQTQTFRELNYNFPVEIWADRCGSLIKMEGDMRQVLKNNNQLVTDRYIKQMNEGDYK